MFVETALLVAGTKRITERNSADDILTFLPSPFQVRSSSEQYTEPFFYP